MPIENPLRVVYRAPAELRPRPGNPRTHSPQQVRKIARSMTRFGFVNPIIVDEHEGVLAGHARLAAAKQAGLARVPTLVVADLSEAEKVAYALADNKLAELAGWDVELLAGELRLITELEVDFDLELTGFDNAGIDLLLQATAAAAGDEPDPLDDLPEAAGPPVSVPGDLWRLGAHRILCGDATDAAAFAELMDGQAAAIVFTDPPYNVPIHGHVSGLGRTWHPEFAMAAGEMSRAEFTAFLATSLGHAARHSADGALHYVCMDWRHLPELLEAGQAVYRELKNLCVWDKGRGGMGSLYRSQHELVLVFKHGTAQHTNNVELGRHGRDRTNVWRYPGADALRPEGREELRLHPTVKPVQLVADVLLDASKRRGLVLDPFLGSGTTVLAAERTGRRCRGLELEGRYVDVAIRRWQAHTGQQAVHAASGRIFAAVAHERGGDGQGASGGELREAARAG